MVEGMGEGSGMDIDTLSLRGDQTWARKLVTPRTGRRPSILAQCRHALRRSNYQRFSGLPHSNEARFVSSGVGCPCVSRVWVSTVSTTNWLLGCGCWDSNSSMVRIYRYTIYYVKCTICKLWNPDFWITSREGYEFQRQATREYSVLSKGKPRDGLPLQIHSFR